MIQEKSAGAVLFTNKNGRKYLLLNYEAGHWDFPKGNIEKNEDEKETILREIEEETGINKIEIIEGFSERTQYFYKYNNVLKHKEVVWYIARTNITKVKISWEHKGYKWLSYRQAMEKITFKNSKEIFEKAHNFLEKKK